jgi:hypothetical protein
LVISAQQALEMGRDFLIDIGRRDPEVRIVTDTTEFFQVDVGDVVLLESGAYLVRGHEREGRFGMDDSIKQWVKKAVDLETGGRKVIKLVFFEKFEIKVGTITYECFRSPRKEGRILDLVRDHPNFMQGFSTRDEKGNNVRVIDFIPGPTLSQYVGDLEMDHETYFHETLPNVLDLFIPCVAGLGLLHRNMEKHGDVRRDHLILGPDRHLSWIDFDYNYRHGEFIAGLDLAGLGNILIFLAGSGDVTVKEASEDYPEAFQRLTDGDISMVFRNRVANLQKLFPYIPDRLNNVLLHFSAGAEFFYNSVDELLDDLHRARADLP